MVVTEGLKILDHLRKQKPALIGSSKEVLLMGKAFGTIERNYYLFIYLFIDINHNCNTTKSILIKTIK